MSHPSRWMVSGADAGDGVQVDVQAGAGVSVSVDAGAEVKVRLGVWLAAAGVGVTEPVG
ncbi:MAG: hypothetical protein M5U11_15780 [Anaerolineales bacterium]|nr:hypothetical protein [Anaerolineales bacterium]